MAETPAEVQLQVTQLLVEWNAGDPLAFERLTPLVYRELRKLAGSYLGRERQAQTLQPTELVHEAYLRLVSQDHAGFVRRWFRYRRCARCWDAGAWPALAFRA